jgi:DNA-binding response OmpR family regulator
MAYILFLETDCLLAKNIKSYLKSLGHETEWHVNPQTAVLSADKKKPDLVILDLMLALHSGVEFLYEFRSYPDWINLPIIIYSNVSYRELGQTSLSLNQLGVSAFHYKPKTSFKDLALSIRQILAPAQA